MKINIGPYNDWFGPYQLAEKIFFWVKQYDEEFNETPEYEKVRKFGDFIAHGFSRKKPEDKEKLNADQHKTWLYKLLLWIDKRKKRKVEIRIDNYDTWGMDSTMAMIIVPMLKQLKETKRGYPSEFVYENQMYGDQMFFTGEGFELPEDGEERWNEVLDKMIWAFEQVNEDWEEQYSTSKSDFRFKKIDQTDKNGKPYYEMVKGEDYTCVTDYDAIKAHQAKMQEGFDLFGKYFRSLWD